MSFWVTVPKAKAVSLQQAININDEVALVLPEKNLPMKFYSDVVGVDNHSLSLKLPEACWNIVKIESGLKVLLMKSDMDKIYYTEGNITNVAREQEANVKISHDQNAVWAERRLFYRFDIRRFFNLVDVVFPDASVCPKIKGICLDMSPGGIGFKTRRSIPAGTRFVPTNLFNPLTSSLEDIDFYLETLWSKGNKWTGYHSGAVFKFPGKKEQDQFTWLLDKLQINRLSWYYHNLQQPQEDKTC